MTCRADFIFIKCFYSFHGTSFDFIYFHIIILDLVVWFLKEDQCHFCAMLMLMLDVVGACSFGEWYQLWHPCDIQASVNSRDMSIICKMRFFAFFIYFVPVIFFSSFFCAIHIHSTINNNVNWERSCMRSWENQKREFLCWLALSSAVLSN